MGSERLELSLARVRTECAAANTLIPRLSLLLSPIGPEGVEPSSGSYKEPALTVELRAVRPYRIDHVSGAGRDRTLACQIKSLLCCLYTTTPEPIRRRRFSRRVAISNIL